MFFGGVDILFGGGGGGLAPPRKSVYGVPILHWRNGIYIQILTVPNRISVPNTYYKLRFLFRIRERY